MYLFDKIFKLFVHLTLDVYKIFNFKLADTFYKHRNALIKSYLEFRHKLP